MSKFEILSKSKHSQLRLKKTSQLKWAVNDNICDLFIDEVMICSNFLPLAFIQNNNPESKDEIKYKLIGLCGLIKNKNAFLNEKMIWTGNYIPAIYRTYPFKILYDKDNRKKIICFDRSSELFTEENDNNSFALFDKDGKASEFLEKKLELIISLENSIIRTNSAIKIITDLNLIEEWNIKLKTAENKVVPLHGLFQVKRDGIQNLNKDELFKLKECNGLELIYSHFCSQRNIHSFNNNIKHDIIKNDDGLRNLRKEVQIRQENEKIKEVDDLVKNLLNDV